MSVSCEEKKKIRPVMWSQISYKECSWSWELCGAVRFGNTWEILVQHWPRAEVSNSVSGRPRPYWFWGFPFLTHTQAFLVHWCVKSGMLRNSKCPHPWPEVINPEKAWGRGGTAYILSRGCECVGQCLEKRKWRKYLGVIQEVIRLRKRAT